MALFLLNEGPFAIFDKIKLLFGVKIIAIPDPNGVVTKEYLEGEGFFSKILTCPYCLSPYVGFLFLIIFLGTGIFTDIGLAEIPKLLLFWTTISGIGLKTYDLLS